MWEGGGPQKVLCVRGLLANNGNTEPQRIPAVWYTNSRAVALAAWAKAVAALMIIGLLLLIIAFIVSVVSLCTLRLSLLRAVGLLLLIAVVLQIIAQIIYPVHFNKLIYEGQYDYSWAYGFGLGATIIMLGCGILFCCLPNYEDELTGMAKTKYIYTTD
ncbi:UNVERIFIED_CONTAM: hypothetical protein FKN15_026356 [Acipenser sinensis]